MSGRIDGDAGGSRDDILPLDTDRSEATPDPVTDPGSGFIYINPGRTRGGNAGDSGAGNDRSSDTGRKRGRPAGSGQTRTAAVNRLKIAGIIQKGHSALAKFLDAPELELDEEESKQLETACKLMLPHTNITLTPRQIDLLIAGEILAEVYGTRLLALYIRRKAPKKAAPVRPGPAGAIFHFPNVGPDAAG